MLFGNDGIFNIANQAKEQYEIGALKDRINNAIADWSIDRFTKPGVTVDDLWDKMVDSDIILDPEEDIEGPEKEGENDVYQVTTNEGYVVEVIISPDGNVTIGEVVKGDSLPPKIVSVETSSGTNNIQVTVTMSRWENGTISYYYKKDGGDDVNYRTYKEGVTELTANIEGLDQNAVYNIRIVAENENGSTEKVVNERTGELKEGTIRQKGPTVWSNGTATIELETTETGVTIQYQIDTMEGQWIDYEGTITGLNHGQTVYAVITDGNNISGYTSIDILDEEKPTVNVTEGIKTTNSIQVNVSASDAEWGMPETVTYNYYIKQTGASYPQTANHTGPETSYTFTGLTQNTSYDVKIITSDKAGNLGEGEATNISTETVGGASEDLKEGNILATEPTWQNGTASITLSKGSGVSRSLTIQYQIGGVTEENWTTATEGTNSVTVTGLQHGNVVYARLTDGTNNGSYASVNVLDEQVPSVPTISITSGTAGNNGYYKSNVVVTITAGSDGQSGVNQVKYSVSGAQTIAETTTVAGITTESMTITTEGTSTITAYTIDKAGNVSAAKTQVVNKDATDPSTASLTVGVVGETSIAVTAQGTDSTSGIYSYEFQRSTTSTTTGFTTVATKTSTATSYAYTYTGLADGTTYYLRVVVTDRAGNTRKGSAVTQETTKKLATNVNELKEGDRVIYPSTQGNIDCVVLYDSSSSYGVEIITNKTVEQVRFGNGVFDTAMNDYNNWVELLNNETKNYLNQTYADRARCVGSIPDDPYYDEAKMFASDYSWFSGYNKKFKESDNNYLVDWEQMNNLNINGGTYYLGSRAEVYFKDSPEQFRFKVRLVSNGTLNSMTLCHVASFPSGYQGAGNLWYGLRPVFHLKSNIKVTGGNGTESNPYILGTVSSGGDDSDSN